MVDLGILLPDSAHHIPHKKVEGRDSSLLLQCAFAVCVLYVARLAQMYCIPGTAPIATELYGP